MKKKAYISELLTACAAKDQRILELEAWQKAIIHLLFENGDGLLLIVKKAKAFAGLAGSILAIDEWDFEKNMPAHKEGKKHV